jgi:N-acetylmuramoyl-L-alanine amidase
MKEDGDLSTRTVIGFLAALIVVALQIFVWAVSASNTIQPVGIIIHHSGLIPPIVHLGAMTRNRLPMDLESWDAFHQRRGFRAFYWGRFYHIGYHYGIFPDGRVEQGRPEHCIGSHAHGFNNYIGIAVIGDFSSKDNPKGEKSPTLPTQEQVQALVELCRRLQSRYGIPIDHILRHQDVARTECPGDRFPFEQLIQALHR